MKNREHILKALRISEDEWHNLIIDSLTDYLAQQQGWTARGRAALARSRMFSHWWFCQWDMRDALWLSRDHMRNVPAYLNYHLTAPPHQLPRVFYRTTPVRTAEATAQHVEP
jgi:hypothetical protein